MGPATDNFTSRALMLLRLRLPAVCYTALSHLTPWLKLFRLM
jgi:hypothetical protein